MKVFMLGWEFPPFISGGLGTACHGLTKAMNDLGLEVTFVVPQPVESDLSTHVKMLSPLQCQNSSAGKDSTNELSELSNVKFHSISSPLQAYTTPQYYEQKIEELLRQRPDLSAQQQGIDPAVEQWLHETQQQIEHITNEHYGGDMYSEIHRYAASAVRLAVREDFDVIHAHDWMTYPAGIAVASITGKPLVVHVHSTEFDRSGEHINQMIYDIERRGMHAAQKIIAVSYLTRNIIITRYGVLGEKVEVVYNGV
ncbi:MAG: glycosyltransferase, partial [Planctomycetota bacterium]